PPQAVKVTIKAAISKYINFFMKNFIWLITAANIHKFETQNKISLKNENLFINSRFFFILLL
ncbi:MAG: hypothetical protein ABR81_04510, partial [Cryomorphaceae bacterium BACL11 MAG-121128-bin16]